MRRTACALLLTVLGCSSVSEPFDPNAPRLRLFPDPSGFDVTLGFVAQLPPALIGPRGDTLPLPAGLLVFSRHDEIASVHDGLVVRANGPGATWIVGSVVWNGRTLTDSVHVKVSCTDEIGVHVTPSVIVVGVGESVTPGAVLFTCGGYRDLTDTYTWTAVDPTIISVDAVTGRTTGLRVGATGVAITGAKYGNLGGIPVKVR